MSDLKLLFDAHQLGRRQTGNETYVRALLREYQSMADLQVTAFVEAGAVEEEAVREFATQPVPRSGFRRLLSMAIGARRRRPDVMHSIYFAPYFASVPQVLTIHDISFEMYPEFFTRAERLRGKTLIRDGARRADMVVTVSETSRRDLVERYHLSEDKVIAIHNGVGRRFLDAPTKPIESIGDRPVRILAVGTLQPRKNLERLLAAVRHASQTRPIQLRVVGPDGFQASLIKEALQGSAVVEVVGYVPDNRLISEYQGADMLVYPSLYEGFGLPIVEAMACGVPVVTSTGGSLPEVAGDAAVVVEPRDTASISDAILRLADDVELRRTLVSRGHERAAKFSWAVSAERHLEVYRSLAGDA